MRRSGFLSLSSLWDNSFIHTKALGSHNESEWGLAQFPVRFGTLGAAAALHGDRRQEVQLTGGSWDAGGFDPPDNLLPAPFGGVPLMC